MRFFPVINLGQGVKYVGPRPLSDETVDRLCSAFKEWSDWQDWKTTESGSRHIRDAAADVGSILNKVPWDQRGDAIRQLNFFCEADVHPLLQQLWPQPTMTTPQYPFGIAPPPPPPPPYEPGRTQTMTPTGQPGPGAGTFKREEFPDVATTGTAGPPYTPVTYEPVSTTGSEPEPEPTPPTPPPPAAPARPPVASEGRACWYVIGQGYTWGPRPSGGESTGLNQSDCAAIQARYNEVRGLPQVTSQPGQTDQSMTNTQPQTSESVYNPNTPMAPQERAPVATGGPGNCPPGQFWDGRQCRGSVAPGAGGFANQANFAPSAAGMPTGNVTFGGLGKFSMNGTQRFPVVNL